MGSKYLSKVQYGLESTRGTAVPATRIWTGSALAVPSDTQIVYPEEQFGVRSASRRSTVQQKLFTGSLVSDHNIFQNMRLPFECGLKGGVTWSEVTPGQADYKGVYTPSLTAANSPKAFTVELGDDSQFYEVEYCQFERIHLSGSIGQGAEPSPVKLEADFYGRQTTATTVTAGLSPHTPTGMNAAMARLYLDTAWSGVGGTELTNLLRSFDLEILTGVHYARGGSASTIFTHHNESVIGVILGFTVEAGAVSAAKYLLQQSQTFQAAQLDIVGAQIGSGTNHRLRVQLGGTFEEVTQNESDDRGDNLSAFVLHGYYDATGAKELVVEITTNVDAV